MKKTLLTLLLAVLGWVYVQAQRTISTTLSTGATLDYYRLKQADSNGRAIILCPGGGYTYLASTTEGTDWVPYFQAMGYNVGVLSYRMPAAHADRPLADAEAAIKFLREKGERYYIQNGCVGVMGFSAGGHVASTLSTHADAANGTRPDFQILFYPVITMDPAYTHMGSHDALLGSNPSEELEALYSNEKHVTDNTPPAFITYAANDGTVSPDNSKNYYKALQGHHVPAYIKEYPTGGHGFGFKTTFAYHDDVLAELKTWLEGLDDLLPNAIEAPQTNNASPSDMIYTLSGISVGTSLNTLPKGVYIRDGHKVVK